MSTPQRLPRVLPANEIVPAMKDIVAQLEAIQDEIVRNVTPSTATFDTVLRPYAQLQNRLQDKIGVIFMLQYAAPDMETQDAVAEAILIWSQAEGRRNSREDIFRLLEAVDNAKENLDPESRLFLRERLLDFKQHGIGVLNSSQVKEYVNGSVEINDMCRTFQRNIAMEDGGVWFTEEELDGVPSHDLNRWEQEAGKWFVPFSNSGTTTVLAYAHNPETRKRMFLADEATLSQNAPLFEKIVAKRCMQASSLGYPHHASYRAQGRLIKSAEWIGSFLDQVKTGLAPLVQREVAIMQRRRLRDLQRGGQHEHEGATPFPVWDKAYYTEVLKQEFGVNQAKVSEFFPLETTATAMLDIFSSLLGVRFHPIPTSKLNGHAIWHDSVKVYSVREGNSADFIGYLYFDLVWRENKCRGSQNVTHECGYAKGDGTRQYPSTTLMCSFPASTPTKCALLKHSEVVTLFHELGHGIHNLISRTKYCRFHGTNISPDFGEMPSIMLENWCWMKDVLQKLSCHYTALNPEYLLRWQADNEGIPDPPPKIPDELVDNLISRRYFNRALYCAHQLTVSIFDLLVHTAQTTQDLAALNFQRLWYDLREELEGLYFGEAKQIGFNYVHFTHLTAGYDTGYYSYLACSAFAQDLFATKFAKEPHNPETWQEYRHGILEYGGSHPDMMVMLQDFLGHPPDSNALIKSLEQANAR